MLQSLRCQQSPHKGVFWQFAKLKSNLFTREIKSYLLSDLDKLFAAVNYIFLECQHELEMFNN
jgi:hypothetical protein